MPRASRRMSFLSTTVPPAPIPRHRRVWYYDYRTNVHHTLKQKPLTYAHLEDFVACYNPKNRHVRQETWSEETPEGRWRAYSRDDLLQRDKASLDVFWMKDASMTDSGQPAGARCARDRNRSRTFARR